MYEHNLNSQRREIQEWHRNRADIISNKINFAINFKSKKCLSIITSSHETKPHRSKNKNLCLNRGDDHFDVK